MPLWVRILTMTADPAEVAPAAAGHREQLAALRAAGRLRYAGTFGRDDGYLDVFEAPDRHAAEATLRESPLVQRGLCAFTLRPFVES